MARTDDGGDPRPGVLFVCVKNGGKSQIAAALMRQTAGDLVRVESAGTRPGTALNPLSVAAIAECGLDMSTETPKGVTPELVERADLVVTLGAEAVLGIDDGTPLENWVIDEPSERGIDGIERMRLVRDDIAAHVDSLTKRLLGDDPISLG